MTQEELLQRIMQLAANAGGTDVQRALNYLLMRYPAVYTMVAEAFRRDVSLTGVEVRPSGLTSGRKIVDVIFTFTNRRSGAPEKYFVRVDVTERFPFLVGKLAPYVDRQA